MIMWENIECNQNHGIEESKMGRFSNMMRRSMRFSLRNEKLSGLPILGE
jgi:hypothetical protein